MKQDWYVLFNEARYLVNTIDHHRRAQSLLETIVKTYEPKVELKVTEDGEPIPIPVEPKSCAARLLLARFHKQRTDILTRLNEEKLAAKQARLASSHLNYLMRADDEQIRTYAEGYMAFNDKDHDKAREYLTQCRRPTYTGGKIKALLPWNWGYIKHWLNTGDIGRTEEEREWVEVREEIYNNTERLLIKMRRGTQKMTAVVSSNYLNVLALGGLITGTGLCLHLASPDLEGITKSAAPEIKQEAAAEPAVPEPADRPVYPDVYETSKHVVVMMKYEGGKAVSGADVDSFSFSRKARNDKAAIEKGPYPISPKRRNETEFTFRKRGRPPIEYEFNFDLKDREEPVIINHTVEE